MESMVNDFWADRRVFVTGASGLVGGWLVNALLARKADVVILLRDWVPNSMLVQNQTLDQTTIVNGDLRNRELLERIIVEYEIKTVFHLAAQTIVPIANENPLSTFESNITGTWNLLESCRGKKSISEIVIASTDKVYGDTILPYREDNPLAAIYPYDVSKACADMLGMCYAKTWGLPVAITRCGNFFGGGDLNWSRLVPGTIRQILRGQQPIIRSNGQLVRDYIYVEDAVSAYLTLAKKMSKDPNLSGEAYNFSNGLPLTTLQLTEKILSVMDSTLQPTILDDAPCEIAAQVLDCKKASERLEWYPVFGIEEGLQKTVTWYKNLLRNSSAQD